MKRIDKPFPASPLFKTGWPWNKDVCMKDKNVSLPKISVVTPSYNQGLYIEETMRSVLLQDYPNMEYIIIDGGSTDNSLEIIRKYEKWITYWVSEPDRGQSHAINKGWRKATGDIIAWLNTDDFYLPGAFSSVANVFVQNDQARVLSGTGEIRDASGNDIISVKNPSSFDPYDMLSSCGGVPMQPSVFLNRRVLDEVGFLNEDIHYTMDWEYWIRMGLYYHADSFIPINKALSVNREWPHTKTHTGWKLICREHRRVMDSIFSSLPNDHTLQKIKYQAYRSSYLKEADLSLKNRDRAGSIKSIVRAWLIRPFAHNPRDELVTLMQLFGYYRNRGK